MYCLKARSSERIASAEVMMNELSHFMTVDPFSAAESLSTLLIDLFPQQHADFIRDLEHGLIRP